MSDNATLEESGIKDNHTVYLKVEIDLSTPEEFTLQVEKNRINQMDGVYNVSLNNETKQLQAVKKNRTILNLFSDNKSKYFF